LADPARNGPVVVSLAREVLALRGHTSVYSTVIPGTHIHAAVTATYPMTYARTGQVDRVVHNKEEEDAAYAAGYRFVDSLRRMWEEGRAAREALPEK
jgi:hypothetical protein